MDSHIRPKFCLIGTFPEELAARMLTYPLAFESQNRLEPQHAQRLKAFNWEIYSASEHIHQGANTWTYRDCYCTSCCTEHCLGGIDGGANVLAD